MKGFRYTEATPSYEYGTDVVAKLKDAEEKLHELEQEFLAAQTKGNTQQSPATSIGEKYFDLEAGDDRQARTAEDIAEVIKADPHLRALWEHKQENVKKAAFDYLRFKKMRDELEEASTQAQKTVLKNRRDHKDSPKNLLEVPAAVEQYLKKVEEAEAVFMSSSPEAYYTAHLLKVREMVRSLRDSNIIETKTMAENARRIEGYINAGRPSFLQGPPGSGKTEAAIHAANNINRALTQELKVLLSETQSALSKAEMSGAEQENIAEIREKFEQLDREVKEREAGPTHRILSASRFTEISELAGHQTLKGGALTEEQAAKMIEKVLKDQAEWEETAGPDVSDVERDRHLTVLLEAEKLTKSTGVETDFWVGPMYECMEKGVPFIIDEANALPPEVFIRINHLLTRRPGDVVDIQEDGGKQVTIKEGFSFIFTGNIGEQYGGGRSALESSLVNRLGDAMMEIDYLPEDELREIIIAYSMQRMDAKGGVMIQGGNIETISHFAEAVAFAQRVFKGVEDIQIDDGAGQKKSLHEVWFKKQTPFSMRNVLSVLDAYRTTYSGETFEHALYKTFIEPIVDPVERYAYYEVFSAFGYFKDAHEVVVRDKQSTKVITFSLQNTSGKAIDTEFKLVPPREVVDELYGSYNEERDYKKVRVPEAVEFTPDEIKANELLTEIGSFLNDEVNPAIERYAAQIEAVCPADTETAPVATN